ncbi:MAG: DUF4176 domain-containing protein [Clostridiales bacterium]|nr:DUF4176 domain-containing protein [Clostridiales bacterium]
MLEAKKYLPIGSVVLLKNSAKKIMVVGIMQSTKGNDGKPVEYDYIGVLYPEGFLSPKAMFLFNHDKITDVIYPGYENPEREEFIAKLEEVMQATQKPTPPQEPDL